ncbi:hypothetical protein NN561_012638 [Cricetulus griseus]
MAIRGQAVFTRRRPLDACHSCSKKKGGWVGGGPAFCQLNIKQLSTNAGRGKGNPSIDVYKRRRPWRVMAIRGQAVFTRRRPLDACHSCSKKKGGWVGGGPAFCQLNIKQLSTNAGRGKGNPSIDVYKRRRPWRVMAIRGQAVFTRRRPLDACHSCSKKKGGWVGGGPAFCQLNIKQLSTNAGRGKGNPSIDVYKRRRPWRVMAIRGQAVFTRRRPLDACHSCSKKKGGWVGGGPAFCQLNIKQLSTNAGRGKGNPSIDVYKRRRPWRVMAIRGQAVFTRRRPLDACHSCSKKKGGWVGGGPAFCQLNIKQLSTNAGRGKGNPSIDVYKRRRPWRVMAIRGQAVFTRRRPLDACHSCSKKKGGWVGGGPAFCQLNIKQLSTNAGRGKGNPSIDVYKRRRPWRVMAIRGQAVFTRRRPLDACHSCSKKKGGWVGGGPAFCQLNIKQLSTNAGRGKGNPSIDVYKRRRPWRVMAIRGQAVFTRRRPLDACHSCSKKKGGWVGGGPAFCQLNIKQLSTNAGRGKGNPSIDVYKRRRPWRVMAIRGQAVFTRRRPLDACHSCSKKKGGWVGGGPAFCQLNIKQLSTNAGRGKGNPSIDVYKRRRPWRVMAIRGQAVFTRRRPLDACHSCSKKKGGWVGGGPAFCQLNIKQLSTNAVHTKSPKEKDEEEKDEEEKDEGEKGEGEKGEEEKGEEEKGEGEKGEEGKGEEGKDEGEKGIMTPLKTQHCLVGQPYTVPLIQPDLRREEAIQQVADALQYLQSISGDIFSR